VITVRREAASGDVTLEGEVARVTYSDGQSGFQVIKVAVDGRGDPVTVVGTFPPVAVGGRVRARGAWTVDKRHGEQLRAETVTELLPSTLVGVERYLGSGLVKGVGAGYARRIVAHFGMDTLRVLDEQPERLDEVEGLGQKRRESIRRAWSDQRAVREIMVFLQAHGASPALASRIHKRYGADAVRVVSAEPYRLAIEVWGVGFKTADRIAQGLGITRDSPARIQAGVLQTLHDITERGHACATADELVGRATAMLELGEHDAEAPLRRAIDALVLGGYVVRERTDEGDLVFTPRMHAAEVRLAERLSRLAASSARRLEGAEAAIAAFERESQVELAPEQRRAVTQATAEQVLVVTGGPGVGKTTIVRAILTVLERERLTVRLAAPTGRAAKRLAESTGREAATLHRLLEFDPKRAVFKRDASAPLAADALIVDEASMIDVAMADALGQALAPGTRLVLVGDVDQLPSVGPGAFLRDVIASGVVSTVRLSRIFRQAKESSIVENAHRIQAGEPPIASQDPSSDFFAVDRRDPEAAQTTIVDLVTKRIPRAFGLDPFTDIQVLTPMHRGAAGSIALNEALQAALNPTGPALVRGARTLRLGDKVMQLKNDYDRDVWNGDVGRIIAVDQEEETLRVRYDDDRDVSYEAAALDELALAYACSVHKSQGSEYPAVVLALLTSHFVMLSKNLFYTAVTRGKRLVVLVADPRAVRTALADDRRGERRTRLEWRLRHAGL